MFIPKSKRQNKSSHRFALEQLESRTLLSASLDFSGGFASASNLLAINGSAQIAGSDLALTDGTNNKSTSVYAKTQQTITGFTTQFDFQLTGLWPLGDGFTFVLQRSSLSALGSGRSQLGYGPTVTGGTGGINNSIAIKFDVADSESEGTNSTGLYVNGEAPTLAHSIWLGNTGFNMRSYNPSRAKLTYDGSTLTVLLTDLTTGATATQNYAINIPATIGGDTAWAGFTAATGDYSCVAHIKNWTFETVPVPPSAPYNLTAAEGDKQVTLNWNAGNGVDSYTVKYGTTAGGPYTTTVSGITSTNKTITGLTDGTTYYFVVSATNANGTSINSAEVNASPIDASITLNYAKGFTNASPNFAFNGAGHIEGSDIVLTGGQGATRSSIWALAQQNVQGFSTQFDFQLTGNWPLGDGFTFAIQRSSLTAIGQEGGGLGYGSFSTAGPGISNSIAVKFDIYNDEGEGSNATGLYVNGETPTINHSINLGNTGFDLRSYDPSRANITYDGTTLTVVLTDLKTGATATQSYAIDIPTTIGGTNAWIGFTAGSGHFSFAGHISKWTYKPTSVTPVVPAIPANVVATPANHQVSLTWAAAQSATSYNVKYSTTPGGPYTTITGVTGTSKTVQGLTNGTKYYFVVSGVNGALESDNSTETFATPAMPLASVPTGLTATAGDKQVVLNWSPSTSVDTYTVKYGSTNGGPYTTTVTGVATNSKTITGLTNGTTYYFVVSASNADGVESANSAQAFAAPAAPVTPLAPTALNAIAGNGQVALTWSAAASTTSYTVKYGTAPGVYTTTVAGLTTTSKTITSLNNGTTYYFVVTASNGALESTNSSEVFASPAIPAPDAPTGLTATAADGQITLNWTASTYAATYTVKYGTAPGVYTTTLTNLAATSKVVTSLTNGTKYYFVVTATNTTGTSGNSNEVNATPSASSVTIDYSTGFAGAGPNLAINGGNGFIGGNDLILTDATGGKRTSVWALAQQNVQAFSTTFDFRLTGNWPQGDGFTFAIQRQGLNAIGLNGGGLGYGNFAQDQTGGIRNSIAVKFDLYNDAGEGTNSTGLYVNGEEPTSNHSIWLGNTGFDLRSYNYQRATITYDGTTLKVVLLDLQTGATATQQYAIDIPATIGGNTAWVGFTAGSGHFSFDAHIQKWVYTAAPTTPVAPAAPANVVATPGDHKVDLTWSASSGATGYNVKYSTTPGGPYTTITGVAGTSTTIPSLTNGTPYYFVVSAVKSSLESVDSAEAIATPAAPVTPLAPTGLNAVAGNGQVSLSWSAAASATSYTVKYGTAPGVYTTTLPGLTATSKTVTGLTNGTTYYFVVSASNAGLESANSAEVSKTPVVPAPAAPTGLTVAVADGQITVGWNAATFADSYTLKYGTAPGVYTTTLAGLTGTSKAVSGLTNGTKYYFVVIATNTTGPSANSSEISATPSASAVTIDYSAGFAGAAPNLTFNGGTGHLDGNDLVLTGGQGATKSSIWQNAQQNVSAFTTSFDFRLMGSWPQGDGFTFAIQRQGLNAIGLDGGGLGYGNFAQDQTGGIRNSIAIKFDLYNDAGEGTNSTGLYINGEEPTSNHSVWLGNTGFDLRSYNLQRATITYDGTTLKVVLLDLQIGATATQSYAIDIPATIGGANAWVGFTAGSGHFSVDGRIKNWTYTTGLPTPSLSLTSGGGNSSTTSPKSTATPIPVGTVTTTAASTKLVAVASTPATVSSLTATRLKATTAKTPFAVGPLITATDPSMLMS